jgi:hypothetical protein
VPDLDASDGWLEAPFWIWSSTDPLRRPLYARLAGDGLTITDRNSLEVWLSVADDRDATVAAQQIADLVSRGIKLRTRALTTTLFARLVLSDLFLHGIGGAKYDQVLDEIVRLFFGFEPPEFGTVSATLRLPIAREAHDSSQVNDWQQRLRELRYHPELFVDGNGDRPTVENIIADKRRWVEIPKTPENAGERHRAIAAANNALQPYLAPLRAQLEHDRAAAQKQRRGEAILQSREYSFCLYPRMHFDTLLREPRLL